LGLLVLPRQKLSYSSADRDLPDVLKGTIASAEDKQGTPFQPKFVEYVIGLRNAVSHLSIDDASPFITNGQNTISYIKLSGETTPEVNGKKVKHCIEYKFNVIAENQLEKVINDILTFIYPCQFKAKNSSVKR
jgi:hypothetical protein